MALVEETLFGTNDKIERAVLLLKKHEPEIGYFLCFSGGKDSQVLYHIMKGVVKFDAHYNNTSCDPPEIITHIKKNYPDVMMHRPKQTMWKLVRRKGLPGRNRRWCCEALKHTNGQGRVCVTGVRKEESFSRSTMNYVDVKKDKIIVNPLLDFTTLDVWDYLDSNHIETCNLYDYFDRLGCTVCPLQSIPKRIKAKEMWPKYWDAMYRAGERWYESRPVEWHQKTIYGIKTWDQFWEHWFYETPLPNTDQTVMFE